MLTAASKPRRCSFGLVMLLALLQGCTHFAVEDCGGGVLGQNEPRIRSSHLRMLLADLPAAASRFAPYAAMSALAYAEDADCGTVDAKLTPDDRIRLEAELASRDWQEVKDVAWTPPCEDAKGLFFRVWKQEAATRNVVIAFRGTWGAKDWLYGNFHWFSRWLPIDDQYTGARAGAQRVFDHFADRPTRFDATGHSLGGGLAQHVLYSYPHRVTQAIAFDPSSVTGFAEQSPANQASACECDSNTLNGEPRILRAYDAYEILANLRFFHKTFFPPERHVQEVRFPNAASHSMKGLAFYLLQNAGPGQPAPAPWFSGKGDYGAGETCTAAFMRLQKSSCEAKVAVDGWNKCPQ